MDPRTRHRSSSRSNNADTAERLDGDVSHAMYAGPNSAASGEGKLALWLDGWWMCHSLWSVPTPCKLGGLHDDGKIVGRRQPSHRHRFLNYRRRSSVLHLPSPWSEWSLSVRCYNNAYATRYTRAPTSWYTDVLRRVSKGLLPHVRDCIDAAHIGGEIRTTRSMMSVSLIGSAAIRSWQPGEACCAHANANAPRLFRWPASSNNEQKQ